jgi:chemotaxis signal transduction protein
MNTYMTLEICGVLYAVELSLIDTVVMNQGIVYFPSLPAYCRGCIRHNERLVPIYDIHIFFNTKNAHAERQSEIALIASAQPFGLLIDRACSTVHKGPEDILARTSVGTMKDKKYIKYFLDHEDGLLAVFDIEYMERYIHSQEEYI